MYALIIQIDQDCLGLSIRPKRMLPHLPPEPTLLGPSKWARKTDGADAIDPYNPRVKGRTQPERAADVLSEDSCHETVFAVVGPASDFLLGIKFVDNHHRPEYLVLIDGSTVLCIREDCRLDVVALSWTLALTSTCLLDFGPYLRSNSLSSRKQCALLLILGSSDNLHNPLKLGLVHDRTDLGAWLFGIANHTLLLLEGPCIGFHKCIVNARLDIYSCCCETDLPAIGEQGIGRP